MPAPVDPLLLLAGPTASGKSDVALCLARSIPGEIVSVDSMQVYRGLDIGTAKPGPIQRAAVRHHLIDVVECHEPFDAARFVTEANAAIAAIQQRHRVPILCGGTGLYFKALLEGLGNAPAPDPALRAELERVPLPQLLEELAAHDPATFGRIDRRNPRRVVRAVEVLRLTGRPHDIQRSPWQTRPASGLPPASAQPSPPTAAAGQAEGIVPGDRPGIQGPPLFVLRRAPDDLRARLSARVDAMFAAGLVEETRRLLPLGLDRNPRALQAIGYRQVVEHLRGEHSLAETVALVKTKTWQYVRRQGTWFRAQPGVVWIDVAVDESPESVAKRIQAHPSGAKAPAQEP